MQRDEYLSQFIAQLSALPPRKRLEAFWDRLIRDSSQLEAFRAIEDSGLRREVAKALPPDLYGEILDESFLDNLDRTVQERMTPRNPLAA